MERIQLAVMTSHDNNGINITSLAKNLSEIKGLTDKDNNEITKTTAITLPQKIKLNNISYIITKDGEVEKDLFLTKYQQVEYIESTGTQYINTEYIPKTNTEIDLDVCFSGSFEGTNEKDNLSIFSELDTDKTCRFQLNFGGDASDGNTLYAWAHKAYGHGASLCKLIINDNIRTKQNLIKMKSGELNYSTLNISLDEKLKDNNSFLYLFAYVKDEQTIIPFSAYNMKVYGFKIYEGDILIKDFIPCYKKETGTCGLYDTIEGKFYTNQNNTGEDFIPGLEV